MSKSTAQDDLIHAVLFHLRIFRAPPFEREFEFHKARRWRFDIAWPAVKVALEVDGGTRCAPVICHQCKARVRARLRNGSIGRELRIGGRHTRPDGFRRDAEKRNAAMLAGWSVFHLTSDMLEDDPHVVAPIAAHVRRLAKN